MLVIVGGVVWFAYRTFAPPSHVKVNAAHEQLSDRFVQALLVRGDCTAAAQLAANRLKIPHATSCWSYVDGKLGEDYYRWHLVRSSGAVVSRCAFGGGVGARYVQFDPEYKGDDDCVAYRLVSQLNGGYEGGYLVVWPKPRDGAWKIRRLDLAVSDCGAGCRRLWARRVPREQA